MKLLKLKLENFQGVKSVEYDFDGKNATIYGDNETGKSTVYNAYTWLLFDAPSTGVKNYTPKTRGEDGEGIHHLNHSVEGNFKLYDGRTLTYKKIYHEVYKKVRGTASEEFSGHTTDYYIDGVPHGKETYCDSIGTNFGKDNIPKLLTIIDYFANTLSWEKRRAILLSICGNVTDEEVITSSKDLRGLNDYLLMPGTTNQYYTVDEYKKIAAGQKSELTRLLSSIPDRIDEANKAAPELPEMTAEEIKKEITSLVYEKECLLQNKASAISGDKDLNAVKRELMEVMQSETEAREKYTKQIRKKSEQVHEQTSKLEKDYYDTGKLIYALEEKHHNLTMSIKNKKARREEYIKSYSEISASSWNADEAICPTCKRELPDEQVSQLKEAFNLSRSNKLTEINTKGREECNRELIAELEALLSSTQKEIQILTGQREALNDELKKSGNKDTFIDFDETEEGKAFAKNVYDIEEKSKNVEVFTTDKAKGYDDEINAVNARVSELEGFKRDIEIAEKQKARVKDLDKEEKTLSKRYELIEKGLYLCELFIRHKVSMLDEKINSKFTKVRFSLFENQINGGLNEQCEVLVPTKTGAYAAFNIDANNAGKINAGLEIIDTLSKYYNLSIPIFVDNAESVTKLLPIDAQVIRLVVSEQDKKLRMEIEQ